MSDTIYYCKQEENDCPVKDTCERYVDAEHHQCKVTLYKAMCVDDNGRVLFINKTPLNIEDTEVKSE